MSRTPLTDTDAVAKVRLLYSVPESMSDPADEFIRKIFDGTQIGGEISAALAIWPDGTWAMLGHNHDWPRPRPEQLIRAYHQAYALGIRMPSGSETLRSA